MRFFSNDEVEAAYVSTFGKDKKITIQGVYSGLLSNITPTVAAKLIALKDNQIAIKPGVNISTSSIVDPDTE